MLSPSAQGQISASLLTVPHSLYITQKINSIPPLSLQSSTAARRDRSVSRKPDASAIAATHGKASPIGNVILPL